MSELRENLKCSLLGNVVINNYFTIINMLFNVYLHLDIQADPFSVAKPSSALSKYLLAKIKYLTA